jgi:hypothetical protein
MKRSGLITISLNIFLTRIHQDQQHWRNLNMKEINAEALRVRSFPFQHLSYLRYFQGHHRNEQDIPMSKKKRKLSIIRVTFYTKQCCIQTMRFHRRRTIYTWKKFTEIEVQ